MFLYRECLLFLLGGGTYVGLEWLWRGFSHPSMFLLGGLCFRLIGLLRRHLPPLGTVLAGAAAITVLELLCGLLRVLLLTVMPLTVAAAFIEAYVTPAVMALFLAG